jgi:predicted dienelactone hydrolase
MTKAQDYSAGERTLILIDSSRNRTVKTELWYPTSEKDPEAKMATELPFLLDPTIRDAEIKGGRYPFVLLSHGTGANRFGLAWIAISLVKNGFIVAAPDHWGNTYDNKIPEYFVRYWERPEDITFVITQLLSDKDISKHIDNSRIGMAGYSFGGYTAFALAGAEADCMKFKNAARTKQGKKEFTIPEMDGLPELIEKIPCDLVPATDLSDNRIKAFVAIAPALGLAFSSADQVSRIKAPVMIIGAANDRIAPVETNARHYKRLLPASEYIELPGKTGHYIFLNDAGEDLKSEAAVYYVDDRFVDRRLIHDQVNELILNFFRSKLEIK